jgi:sulfate permease, SulP family
VIVLEMSDVPSMDGIAVVAVQGLVDEMQRQGVALVFAGPRPTRPDQLRPGEV